MNTTRIDYHQDQDIHPLYQQQSISFTPNKLAFLKNNWMDIYTPLVLNKIDVRLSLTTLTIDLRITAEQDPISLQRGLQFLRAVLFGFKIGDCARVLIDEIQLIKFHLKDMRKMNDNTLSRAIGRIVGRSGATKKIIEDCINCKLIIGDHIILMGTNKEVEMAKESIRRLVSGKSVGAVQKNLKNLKAKEKKAYFETVYLGKQR
ncbi:Pre-rRNA-processing protein PNO1 [Cucumispora dikerogammari]|nr:Pre-rRNA-processing protein PNO1 [Cucumispora dikerogammari]